ncbi:copper homeostasis protein CutC, partial [Microbacterium sp. BF1]
ASAAIDGIETLRALVAAAEGEIEIMAGSGVDVTSAPVLAAAGVDAIHFSAKRAVTEDGGVRMGSASDGVGGYEVTDRDIAFAIRDALAR